MNNLKWRPGILHYVSFDMSFCCCCCFQTVPHGVLCFFPSYNMLDKLSKRWQVGWNFSFQIATHFLFRSSQNLVLNLGVWHKYCRERQDMHQLLRETLSQQEKTQMFCNKRDRKHVRLLLQRFLTFSHLLEKCRMNAPKNVWLVVDVTLQKIHLCRQTDR